MWRAFAQSQGIKINLGFNNFYDNFRNMSVTFRLLLTCLLVFIFLRQYGCASRGRPGGGPIDKIPPEITATFPQPDSLNITNLQNIEIQFSERMDEASVANSIFISPPLDYEASWSGGDEVSLELKTELDIDRTYLITIGTGAMDARKNKMKNSFQLAFSTGANLDRGQFSGQIYGIEAKDNFYIYAYQIDDPDSLDPTINRADFLTQPSEDGRFSMQYLPLTSYRVFVIEDQNKNLQLDGNSERVGIPFRDVHLDTLKPAEENLNFKTSQLDTLPPALTSARAVFNNRVLLRFSEPVIVPQQIEILDTLSLDTLSIRSKFINSENPSQIYAITELQTIGMGYRVVVHQLQDLNRNGSDQLQSVDFTAAENPDTTRFELLSITPRDSALKVKYPARIEIKFSAPVDTNSLQSAFSCFDGQMDTITGSWQFEDLTNCYFLPSPEFLPDQQYYYYLSLGDIRSVADTVLQDSLIQHTFFMISSDEFGSLSGVSKIDDQFISRGYIEVFPLTGNKEPKLFRINSNKTFLAEWLSAGQYQVGGYIDLDENQQYSHGSLFPFKYAEPVFIRPDTFKIRKRWEFGGVDIIYPEFDE